MDIYEDYKDSGVSWLGEVPEHWPLQPGLAIMYENKSKNTGMVRNSVLSLSYGKIRVKDESELTGLVPESFETYQLVDPGDLIFRPTDLQNDKTSLRSSISEFEGIITNAYLNFRFKDGAVPKYYHYFFRAIDNNKLIYGLGSGLRQNISFEDFKRFPFPVPPLQEQQSIADFLDEKTAKIDQAIVIKEKEIQLLKERRQILIQELVTGKKVWDGSSWTAPTETKDSGVDWIGEIPKHWEVRKLKYCLTVRNEKVNQSSTDRIYIGMENVESQTGTYISTAIQTDGAANVFYKDDILFGKLRPYLAKVHLANFSGDCSTEFLVLRGRNTWYYQHLLRSAAFIDLINSSTYGAKMPRANSDFILNSYIPLPTLRDQQEIVNYLALIEQKLLLTTNLKYKEIEKLKEYKTVLINDVVTGKLRVHAGSGKQLTKDPLYS